MDKPVKGFTLIETMVVLMVMGIILGIGMPSFLNLIEKMGAESEAKTLIEGLRTARLIAIEEKQSVVVCPSTDNATCASDSTGWATGFLVFRNDKDTSQYNLDADEEVLFSHQFRASVLVKNPSTSKNKFRYNEIGWASTSNNSILVCAKENDNTNGFRIVVNKAGRVRVQDWREQWPANAKC